MDRSNILRLVSYSRQQDVDGVWRDNVRTATEVFCQVDSVGRSEFFAAGQNGLRPEYRFTVFAGDYNGEAEVEYDGMAYAIYRTFYRRDDNIELYAARRVGVNNGAQNAG